MKQPFVEREAELSRLHEHLQHSYDDQRQICFVVGEAGAGKSTLIHEFSVEAEKRYDNLLFLVGTCNAQTGIGDSYLPFRQIVYQLLGDSDSTGGLVSDNNTERLRRALKTSGRALVEIAPELIGTLIPGAGILMALGKFAADEAGWFGSLKKVAEKSANRETQIDSSQLMFQYTALMREIASKAPLVIVLDDLQWADEASITLLFHLIRELEDSSILFVGMYRPNDIELARNGERHPLRSLLHEVKRYHGDVWIDLDQAQQERGHLFVDALLDTEPNRLDEAFRQRLLMLTGGHPLFTVEIIRNMQDDGDIVLDDEGSWTITAKLDWEEIPARIEAVIEERIDRLDNELKELLSIASVEGQVFTAQVLSDIYDVNLRHVLRRLSRELEKQHRLVRELGEVKVPTGLVFQHAFTHSLFRQYLYSTIGNAERRMFHGDVAKSLENIYGNDSSLIVTQLAHHYTEAGNTERAIKYLTKAAEFAVNVFDRKQARVHIMQALEMTDDLQNSDAQQGWLHYLLGRSEYVTGNPEQAEKEYTVSIEMLTQAGEKALSVHPISHLGDMLWRAGRYSEALEYLQTAYELAVQYEDRMQMATALRRMHLVYKRTGNYDAGVEMLERALKISQEIDDEDGIMLCYNNLAIHNCATGNYDLAQTYYESAIALVEATQDRSGYQMLLDNLASLLRWRGMYTAAVEMNRQAIEVAKHFGSLRSVAFKHSTEAYTYYCMEQYGHSQQAVNLGRPLAEKIQDHQLRADFLQIDGILALRANNLDKAIQLLSQAHALEYRSFHGRILTIYAIALARSGDIQAANNAAILAVDACDELIREQPKFYDAYYSRGLAKATLAIVDAQQRRTYLAQMTESYQDAVNLCHEPGVIRYQQLLLNELKPLDSDCVLEPVSNLLAEVDNATA